MLKHSTTATGSPLLGATDWNADHVIDANGATMATRTDTPAAPTAGNVVMFGKVVAGSALPASIGPDGRSFVFQPLIGQKRVSIWQPVASTTSTNGSLFGFSLNFLGNAAARNVATTNMFTAMHRLGQTSVATTGSRALAYAGSNYWRGNTAGAGGFRAVFRFGISDASIVSGANMFVGFTASSSIGSASSEPSAFTNIIGVGCDSADTVLQLYTNDGTGTATKTSLGANFPANTTNTDAYELVLYCAPNASSIGWSVTRMNTGDVASGTVTTDLPVITQLMLPIFMRGNMNTAAAIGIDIICMYIETDA